MENTTNGTTMNETVINKKNETEELEFLKNNIEKLSKPNQIEILKILKNNSSVRLNENKSGVFVNLTLLPKETINDLQNQIEYLDGQEKILDHLEKQKNIFKNSFFDDKL